MKKMLAFAIAAMALGANAAQINWGATGRLMDDATIMNTANGYATSAYLVYLGTSGATWGDLDADFFDTLADEAVGSKTSSVPGTVLATAGQNLGFTVGSAIPGSGDTYTYGSSTFGIVFVSTNSGTWGDDSYYYTTGPFVLANSGSTYAAATETTTFVEAVGTGSVWTKVPTVPEPSVALMGLLGLGMMLKRRRA